jgi:hypothetical protein
MYVIYTEKSTTELITRTCIPTMHSCGREYAPLEEVDTKANRQKKSVKRIITTLSLYSILADGS